MKEKLLHYIWQHKLFNLKELKTVDGQSLQIIDFGKYNNNGGPDFWNAKIKIDDVVLVGNIELHVSASDWKLHRHDGNSKYKNVILHVVYFNDSGGVEYKFPTLELNGRIPPVLLDKYKSMMSSHQPLPCLPIVENIEDITIEKWKERLLVERLERKSKEILYELNQASNDWEKICYQLLGKYFGSHINKEPFERLTKAVDYRILLKHADDIFQLEAMLFGAAGLLNKDFVEPYPATLKQEYRFLQAKYNFKSLQEYHWQFLRIRPVSFPTIRLAWFAQLMQQLPLFNAILENEGDYDFLNEIEASAYWQEHYTPDKLSKPKPKKIGEDFKVVLKINVFVPLLYAYGKFTNDSKWIDKSLQVLSCTTAENNSKTRIVKAFGWQQNSAYDTQAFIEMYDAYCTKKRCLECSIGNKILCTSKVMHFENIA